MHGATLKSKEIQQCPFSCLSFTGPHGCAVWWAGAYLLVVIGDLLQPHATGPSTFLEWTSIVLMTTVCFALLVAWRWEWQGAVVSLMALVLVAFLIRGSSTFHLALLVMALPGMLYAVDWLAHHAQTHRA
jgi:hypothetical protein